MAHIHQINVSDGGVPKLPVERAYVATSGVVGDDQADKVHHGGPDQALCLFSLEVIQLLQLEGHTISPGAAGENLTIEGLDWGDMAERQRYRLGSDLLVETTFPATPCSKNAQWFVDGNFRRISDKAYPGSARWYAKVIEPGEISAGDEVELITA